MDLLRDDVGKLYRGYLGASLGSAVVTTIYSFVDAIAVGQSEGPNGAAAMAVINPMYGVIVFLSLLCSIGGSVLAGHAWGQGERERGNRYFTASSVLLCVIMAVYYLVFGLFAEPIFTLFGADEVILPLAMRYARIIIIFSPTIFISIFLEAFLRNDGDPGLAMKAVVIGGCLNMFGDWLLVFPLGMGIAGAAVATIVGTVVQLGILCLHFVSGRNTLRLCKVPRMARHCLRVMRAGFGAAMMELGNVVLFCIINNQIMRYAGADELAVFGAVETCGAMFQSVFGGVGQAIQPMVSANLGAGQPERIHKSVGLAKRTVAALGTAFFLLGMLFPRGIVRLLMEATPAVLALAGSVVRPYFVSFLFMGWNVLAIYYFQSTLRPREAMTVALSRGFVLSGALALLLPLRLGIAGVWMAVPVTEGLVLCCVALTLRKKRQMSN